MTAANSEARKRREGRRPWDLHLPVGNSLTDIHQPCRTEIERLTAELDRARELADEARRERDWLLQEGDHRGAVLSLRHQRDALTRERDALQSLVRRSALTYEPVDLCAWDVTPAEADAIRNALAEDTP